MAPVSVVGEDVHGNMMPTTVDGILLAVEMAEKKGSGTKEEKEQGKREKG
jgi:hypothetical protein